MKSWQVLLDFANELLTQDTSPDFSPELRGSDKVAGGQVNSSAKRGAPSFAYFAKGGIHDSVRQDLWYPTLAGKTPARMGHPRIGCTFRLVNLASSSSLSALW